MNNSDKYTCMSNDEFDRISSLPDEMLQHILSFLGIRQAVQASLVSKRWVNLWTSLSRLNFDPHEFVSVDEYGLSTEDRKKALDAKFKEFVGTLLSHREASFLDTFLIKILDQDCCSDLVHTCVSYSVKFNPRVFSVQASFLYKDISASIFSCESIEELCLRTSVCAYPYPQEIPEVVNLPRIRRLQLTRTRLDNRSFTRLFSGCPVLEDLSLEGCIGICSCIFSQKLKYLSLEGCIGKCSGIFSQKLKYLSLRSCHFFLHGERIMYVRCWLGDAVKLRIVIFRGWSLNVEFVWKTLSTTAVGNTFSFMPNLFRCLELGDYFGGLSGVTVLKLHSEDMMSILEETLPKLGVFDNLIDLCLGSWCMSCNFSQVALFLQQTPNLQKITLHMCARHCRGEETGIHRLVNNLMWVKLSRCKNLKLVDIKLLKDYIRTHKIDETLLPSRKELENIEVVISEHV